MIPRLRLALPIIGLLVAGGIAAAQENRSSERQALGVAKREAEAAILRSQQLEREADAATDEAARARAEAAALAARIEASEADITAAEARLRIVEALRTQQRARLAEKQEPIVRLTAALQTMARRPPALAFVQPGSLDDLVHVRALLASTLPIIRQRTAALREEVERGNRLRELAESAVSALVSSREELKRRRMALAKLEVEQRERSANLAESALFESDRALALGEQARELSELMGTRQYQDRLRGRLAQLPGPMPRPRGSAPVREEGRRYLIPVEGRVVTGMGEISDAGVHARGLTFEAEDNSPIVAPASGTIVYAGPFMSYGNVVIIEHPNGWTSTLTNVGRMDVNAGDRVRMGRTIGRTATGSSRVSVELRRSGRPVAIAPLLGLG
jgi:septal ring factor EnvC (AmiA/AmiB activator)